MTEPDDLIRRRPNRTDVFTEIRDLIRPIDFAVLLGVPFLLVAVFALPQSVKLGLALAYTSPTVLSVFASHFVHIDAFHLLANLLGYTVLVVLAYVFSLLSTRRTHFFIVFATFLFVFPFALSALNVILVRPRIGFGFSGIVMAFLGFLPLPLLWYLRAQFSRAFDTDHSPLFFFLGMGMIAAWGVPATSLSTAVAISAGVIGAYYLWQLAADFDPSWSVRWWSRPGYSEFAVAGILLYFLFPLIAFPPNPVGEGTVVNLYVHLLGYGFGYIVPYVTFLLTDPSDR